ncbi:MAG: response regulator [Candidatus Magasanikbacteria bacterium]|nr:response regulator [Candidatus Magasanikbacteria bacterium]
MKEVLVVEDEVELAEVIASQLKEEKIGVRIARDGVEGLEMALKLHPDLILLDIIMPKMDGMTMLAHLRKDSWGKDAKVILLTNLSDNEKVAEAIKQQSYDYLVKADWNIRDVVKLVKEKLEE